MIDKCHFVHFRFCVVTANGCVVCGCVRVYARWAVSGSALSGSLEFIVRFYSAHFSSVALPLHVDCYEFFVIGKDKHKEVNTITQCRRATQASPSPMKTKIQRQGTKNPTKMAQDVPVVHTVAEERRHATIAGKMGILPVTVPTTGWKVMTGR